MKLNPVMLIIGLTAVLIVGILAVSLSLTPEQLNPAFDAAVAFMNSAGHGDDDTALRLVGADLRAYIDANCGGSAATCVARYIPAEWGDLITAEYRRAQMDGRAWEVQLFAIYEEDKGFAGVCIYHRMEEIALGDWRVMAWSGFIPCDESDAGLSDLLRPDADNRAP